MQKSKRCSLKFKFSHIYVEKNILAHPLTREILCRFKSSEVIPVEHYKDVFNKSGQAFIVQKQSMKLILAKKREPFLYEGSNMCDSFGHDYFYYTSSAMNCIYNCEYCFLQGTYNSGNLVIFVNLEDTFKELANNNFSGERYICISYDTDLLAIEKLTGFVRKWIDFASKHKNVLIELRTKSGNFFVLSDLKPIPEFIFSWSISPGEIIDEYEKDTPGLELRVKSMRAAIEKGWKVRLCIDPVIYTPDYEKKYYEMSEYVKENIDLNKLEGISIGAFRVPCESLKKMRQNNPESALLAYPFELDKVSGSYSYNSDLKAKMMCYVKKIFDING